MNVVILAAGMGSRLGRAEPKPLTLLGPGRTILGQQLTVLEQFDSTWAPLVVVGFKKELIMEAFPEVSYVYNRLFDQTNTSKSLLRGLEATGDDPVLWLNGDVVFDESLLLLLGPHIDAESTFVAVNRSEVGAEEVKYRVDSAGNITQLSKEVVHGLGEAVGVNFVSSTDKPVLIESLRQCEPHDYFERAIEAIIHQHGREVRAVDISDALCIEVDFESDLVEANELLALTARKPGAPSLSGPSPDQRSESDGIV
jgi:L-glutamine-phosphate cytidylyltransferase